MLPCRLVKIDSEVAVRLAEFGVRREDVIRVVLAAVSARNDSIPFDPKTGKGLLGYIFGVREMRNVFVLLAGYEPISRNNIEAVYDARNGRKIMFQAADVAGVEGRDPKAISEIGSGKETLITKSIGYLFPEMEAEDRRREEELDRFEKAEAWYVFAAFTDDGVTCELSRPRHVVNGQFDGFIERILILGEGEPGGGGLLKLDDDLPPLEIKPEVFKK